MNALLKAAVNYFARGIGLSDPRLYNFFGSGPSSAGEQVTPHSAMQLDTVWACVRLIAQTIATLPLHLYKSDASGRGIIQRDHPLYRLLHDQPNFDMTAVSFWEAITTALLLWGNAYIRIDRGTGNRVIALTPMQPDRVEPRRQPDGSLLYIYRFGSETWNLPESRVAHIKGFTLDGFKGVSVIAQARETLGLAQAAERSAASLFRNGMRGTSILTAPTYLDDARRLRYENEFLPKATGSINAGRMVVLEGGWKIEQISLSPGDAELLATRQFSVEQICRWYGVAPAMIGHMEKATAWGTGLEQMNLWFLTYGLRPHLRAIEQEVARSLLSGAEKQSYYAEFNVDGLLRADSAGRANMMKVLAENGLRTRNELRALDNLEPVDGGDDLTVQSNLLPVQLLGEVAVMPREKPVDPAQRNLPPGNTAAEPAKGSQ